MRLSCILVALCCVFVANPVPANSLKYLVNEEGYEIAYVAQDISFIGCEEGEAVSVGTWSFTCFRNVQRYASGPAVVLMKIMELGGREQFTSYLCPLEWDDCVSADPEPWPYGE